MKKMLSTPVMAVAAVVVWLAACGLLTWAYFVYDGAVNGNPVYFWAYGGAILFAGAFTENYTDGWTADRGPRWASALLLLLCTALAYLLSTDTIHIYRSFCCMICCSGGSCYCCWSGSAFRHTNTAGSAAP